jgi:iron-sulfur cluster assembly protein
MLTITASAAQAIQAIVASTDLPDDGGIRIASGSADQGEAGFDLTLAPEPVAGDEVVEEEGARVFLDADASNLLGDQALDARMEGGQVSFGLLEQEGEEQEGESPEGEQPQ